jgi:hypothetical protein
MRTTLKAKLDGATSEVFCLGRSDCKSVARTIFIEPVLIVASSLLWIIVLPFAAVVCSGIAISNLVEAS